MGLRLREFLLPLPKRQESPVEAEREGRRSVGYATACIGKWHLGFGEGKCDWNQPLKPGPLEVGFDYYFGMPTVNSGGPYVFVENHGVLDYDPKDPFDPTAVPSPWLYVAGNHDVLVVGITLPSDRGDVSTGTDPLAVMQELETVAAEPALTIAPTAEISSSPASPTIAPLP